MAFCKLAFIVLLLLPFIFTKVTWADPARSEGSIVSQDRNGAVTQLEATTLEQELYQLKSRIFSLETSIEDQTGELNKKDGGIKQLEKVIEEKSNSLASLQSTVRLLEEKGSLELNVGEVDTRVNELEKQVVNLKKEIEAQNKKKKELEARANFAEKMIKALNLELENLREINEDQRSRIRNSQHALQVAEEEMLRAKLESSSLTKQFKEVHQAWLPHWVSAHLVHIESFFLTHWNDIGRPAFNWTIQEAIKQKKGVEKWAQPHLDTMKTKWSPALKKQYDAIVSDFYPLIQSFSTQAVDYCHLTWIAIKPHIVKILETMDPYFQETKMLMKPHIDQVLEITKPHLDKARLILKPYSKIVHYHKKITENVRVYHSRVQATLHETLISYELTKPLATEGLVRFMASVLMLLPLIVLFRILVPKGTKKQRQGRSHTRRRAKRVRTER